MFCASWTDNTEGKESECTTGIIGGGSNKIRHMPQATAKASVL